MSSHKRSASVVQLASGPAAAAPSLEALFDEAHAPFLAVHGLVEGAIRHGTAGQSPGDHAGAMLYAMQLLLDDAFAIFEKLKNELADGCSAKTAEELRKKALYILSSALEIAWYVDRNDGDDGESGYLIFPIKLLLEDSNHRFSEFETALIGADK